MAIAPANRRGGGAVRCVLAILALLGATGFASASPAKALRPATADAATATLIPEEPTERLAAWPPWLRGRSLFGGSPAPTAPCVPDPPHPAVARIIVPEEGATAYGSGTLVDVRDQFGLVVTNWHVVRDSQGTVEVVFPSGFRSHARPLKVDRDWDLAALVIWRPPIEPVRVSQMPPRPGDLLTIHGYGQGQYRIATGRCTAFYAPKLHFPQEMVELDVQARQGDSGGPIFNQRGEMAGVLFGAGEGTTIGSFAPRVESFLATLAPDIGANTEQAIADVGDRPAPEVHTTGQSADDSFDRYSTWPSSPWNTATLASNPAQSSSPTNDSPSTQHARPQADVSATWHDVAANAWFDRIKSTLAIIGLAAIGLQLVRFVK